MSIKRKVVVPKNTIYLRAAMNVHKKIGKSASIFSCNEIDKEAKRCGSKARKKYEYLFTPDYAWMTAWLNNTGLSSTEKNEWRIMALLFMHAMVNNP